MKTEQIRRIFLVRGLMVREDIEELVLNMLEENGRIIGGGTDFSVKAAYIEHDDARLEKNIDRINNVYRTYRCGCEHDCCGCLSSLSAKIHRTNSGFSVIGEYHFNY